MVQAVSPIKLYFPIPPPSASPPRLWRPTPGSAPVAPARALLAARVLFLSVSGPWLSIAPPTATPPRPATLREWFRASPPLPAVAELLFSVQPASDVENPL